MEESRSEYEADEKPVFFARILKAPLMVLPSQATSAIEVVGCAGSLCKENAAAA